MKANVVVDVGNSRIKWGLCGPAGIKALASLPHEEPALWEKQIAEWELTAPSKWVVTGVHPQSRERIDALYYLRRLWTIFIDDLSDPNNELPDQLRAGIISIGIWMNKEIDRVLGGQTNDLTPMIEINQIIRDGLK